MTLIEIFESRKEALNVEQVAELLGVSEKKIYRLAAAGVLPSFRVGNAIRFDGQDMADWLRRNKPSDKQYGPHKLERDEGWRSDRKGPQSALPNHIWHSRVRSLESALAMSSSADCDSVKSS